MPEFGIGALGYLGYGPESSEGVAVAPTKFLPVTTVNFPDSNDYLSPLTITGSRDITLALPAPFNSEGSMELFALSHDIGNLLKSAWAASVYTSGYAGGGYQHVFTPGNSSPTMTFERSVSTDDDTLVMRYSGCRVNTFEMKASFGEIVMWTVGIDGVERAQVTNGGDPVSAPTYHATSVKPFHFTGATVDIGGSTSSIVKDLTLSVNNNCQHVGTLRGTRSYRRVALGPREVGLTMALDFTDDVEYNRMLDDDEFAVSLYFETGEALTDDNGMISLRVDLPRVKYKTVGLPLNAPDLITQDVECTVLKPVSGDIASVTLVNNESDVTLLT